MKTLLVILAMLFSTLCYADDKQQVWKDNYPVDGSYYKNSERYEKHDPVDGSYLKQEYDKQQVYENHYPKDGSYYKDGQRYENHYPVDGDIKDE